MEFEKQPKKHALTNGGVIEDRVGWRPDSQQEVMKRHVIGYEIDKELSLAQGREWKRHGEKAPELSQEEKDRARQQLVTKMYTKSEQSFMMLREKKMHERVYTADELDQDKRVENFNELIEKAPIYHNILKVTISKEKKY